MDHERKKRLAEELALLTDDEMVEVIEYTRQQRYSENADKEICVVCLPYDPDEGFTVEDNVINHCLECGRQVQHRPTVPEGTTKICKPCMEQKVEENKVKSWTN